MHLLHFYRFLDVGFVNAPVKIAPSVSLSVRM
jgi:hypothetical protein